MLKGLRSEGWAAGAPPLQATLARVSNAPAKTAPRRLAPPQVVSLPEAIAVEVFVIGMIGT
jgi:hypothetical protein